MSSGGKQQITDQLISWNEGDEDSRAELWPLVYNELRRIAGEMMKGERANHTLQPTALVNEAYLKLADQRRMRFNDRHHFFAMAAKMMRRILVDHARAKRAAKRDGGERVEVDMTVFSVRLPDTDVIELDDALTRLQAMEPEKARVVELKFFGGLTTGEASGVMGCSERTIRRHWQVAKLWLYRELSRGSDREI